MSVYTVALAGLGQLRETRRVLTEITLLLKCTAMALSQAEPEISVKVLNCGRPVSLRVSTLLHSCRYPHSGIIKLHHLLFLAFFGEDMQKTFTYLRVFDRGPMPMDVRYFAHKLQARLSSSMMVEDFLTQSLLRSARRHHRNILVQLVQFWQVFGRLRTMTCI